MTSVMTSSPATKFPTQSEPESLPAQLSRPRSPRLASLRMAGPRRQDDLARHVDLDLQLDVAPLLVDILGDEALDADVLADVGAHARRREDVAVEEDQREVV